MLGRVSARLRQGFVDASTTFRPAFVCRLYFNFAIRILVVEISFCQNLIWNAVTPKYDEAQWDNPWLWLNKIETLRPNCRTTVWLNSRTVERPFSCLAERRLERMFKPFGWTVKWQFGCSDKGPFSRTAEQFFDRSGYIDFPFYQFF